MHCGRVVAHLPWDAEPAVALGTVRKHYLSTETSSQASLLKFQPAALHTSPTRRAYPAVHGLQLWQLDIPPNSDIANKHAAWVLCNASEVVLHILHDNIQNVS
jgi:hypothetical protein